MTVDDAQSICERVDPRVRRTRQMLKEALESLLGSKSIEQISVADIAEAATLNRATFYDHYTDKLTLLGDLVESRFQELLARQGIVFDGTCPQALKGIILATCNYLAGLPGIDCPTRRQIERHFESAMIAVVREMILQGLKEHPLRGAIAPELAAATISGAIYGGASEWIRTPERGLPEQAMLSIFALVSTMLEAN